MRYSIDGLHRAQLDNQRMVAAVRPNGGLGRAVQYATVEAHLLAAMFTHVDTGTLRASHRIEYTGSRGRIFIDPSAVNPKSGRRPVDYGVKEEARGGRHAFYGQAVSRMDRIGGAAWRGLVADLP